MLATTQYLRRLEVRDGIDQVNVKNLWYLPRLKNPMIIKENFST